MKLTTLCFLLKNNEVLLAMKKRGFGAGKWNGVGGKVKAATGAAGSAAGVASETVEAAAIREIREEIGVTVAPEDLMPAGTLDFRHKDKPQWNTLCSVFTVARWSGGEPAESEEVRPAWYAVGALPFAEMWADDPHWLPLVLAGKKIEGVFLFDDQGRTVLEKNVRAV